MINIFDYKIIKKLNSKNISVNPEITKERIKEIWERITKKEKLKAVEVGGFSNIRSFNKTRITGVISIRMAMALAVALEINPFYLSAEEDNKGDYSEEKLMEFIKAKNIGNLDTRDETIVMKENFVTSFREIIKNMDQKTLEAAEQISKEDSLILLNSLLIKEKAADYQIKYLLIKMILMA